MKKRVESIDKKSFKRLFKDSFKMKLIQQIEENIITSQQVKLKYGMSKAVLTEWKTCFGKKANSKKKEKLAGLDKQIQENKKQSKFWKELNRAKSEAALYKKIIELAKSKYGIVYSPKNSSSRKNYSFTNL